MGGNLFDIAQADLISIIKRTIVIDGLTHADHRGTHMITRLLVLSVFGILSYTVSASTDVDDGAHANSSEDLIVADNRRKDRRDDRQENRDDKQDCRQDEGRIGKDKRECKQGDGNDSDDDKGKEDDKGENADA